MFRRLCQNPRLRKLLWRSLGAASLMAFACVTVFLIAVHFAQRDFRPINVPLPADLSARIDRIEKYQRHEDATYLTFTEWYLVFNPQEYARFIAINPPSRFPYFRGIGQIWSGYVQTYSIAQHHYRFNGGYNLMLVVIGVSSTVEFGIKGAYENTVGRIFEWTAENKPTPEDAYAAQVAQDYGNFIPTRPWFEFPFVRKLQELWSSNDFFGPHFLRKCERKFFLSLEYGIKAVYAAIIRLASHSVYGVADTEVYASASNIDTTSLARAGVRPVEQLGDRRWIFTVPHYQGFTDTVPLLAADGVQFEEIAGNDEIMLTIITPSAWHYDLPAGHQLFSMDLLTGSESKRVAVQVPVRSLDTVLRSIQTKGLRLEHLFDY